MSPNHDQGYFSDGLSEELSDRLSRVPGLRVIGRTSAFSFKGKNDDLRAIGRALGVKHLLEGSVRKAGDQLRITAQLVDSNGAHVWSRTYDRKLGDVFAIQDEVAKSVAAALSVTLNPGDIGVAKGGTHNLEAYDAYLAGRALASSGADDDVRHGLEQVERAVMVDPGFALAWSWLALSYQSQNLPERGGAEWNAKALHATARALQLAPDLPSVLAAAAGMSMQHRDWIEAERLTQKALARATGSENIGLEAGWFFVNVGRPREAAEYFRRVKVAEPVLAVYASLFAVTYEMSGDLDQAAAELTRSAPAVADRGFIEANLLMLAMARRDRAQIDKIISGFPADDVIDHAMQARLDEPRAALAELRRLDADPGFPKYTIAKSVLAYWAAYFGDPAYSLTLLHNVRTDASQAFVLWRPILKDMRRLPAFKDLVRDLGLVTYWRASGNWGDYCRPLGEDDFECT
jgi:TolB-like protein/Tfp pilus assembly protein PilF